MASTNLWFSTVILSWLRASPQKEIWCVQVGWSGRPPDRSTSSNPSIFIIFVQTFCHPPPKSGGSLSHWSVICTCVAIGIFPKYRSNSWSRNVCNTELLKGPQWHSFARSYQFPSEFSIQFQVICNVDKIAGIPQQQLNYHFHCTNQIWNV